MQSVCSEEGVCLFYRYGQHVELRTISAAYVSGPICLAVYSPCSLHERAPGNGTEFRAPAAIHNESRPLVKFCSRWGAMIHWPVTSGAGEKNLLEGQRYAAIAQEKRAWPSISCL